MAAAVMACLTVSNNEACLAMLSGPCKKGVLLAENNRLPKDDSYSRL